MSEPGPTIADTNSATSVYPLSAVTTLTRPGARMRWQIRQGQVTLALEKAALSSNLHQTAILPKPPALRCSVPGGGYTTAGAEARIKYCAWAPGGCYSLVEQLIYDLGLLD